MTTWNDRLRLVSFFAAILPIMLGCMLPRSSAQDQAKGKSGGGTSPAPEQALKKGGVYDLYLKSAALKENEPTFARVRFDGVESFIDRKFLRFRKESSPEHVLLVAPEEIAAVATRPPGARRASSRPVLETSMPYYLAFHRLANGRPVWIRDELTDERQRVLFDQVAKRMGVAEGRITLQQYVQFMENQEGKKGGEKPAENEAGERDRRRE